MPKSIGFSLLPAAGFTQKLAAKIMEATFDPANEWFFFDGAFNTTSLEQNSINTWLYEKFVAVYKGDIVAFFDGTWSRPMDIIAGFRTIVFDKRHSGIAVQAFFAYLDYLFVNRGCMAFNWLVALQNEYAMKQYDRFVENYCGHYVGLRHYAQKSYTGKISNAKTYEMTQEEYFEWKERGFKKRPSLT